MLDVKLPCQLLDDKVGTLIVGDIAMITQFFTFFVEFIVKTNNTIIEYNADDLICDQYSNCDLGHHSFTIGYFDEIQDAFLKSEQQRVRGIGLQKIQNPFFSVFLESFDV
jgi:DNA-dependent RNA polymerase auxiliary subunit epsilon